MKGLLEEAHGHLAKAVECLREVPVEAEDRGWHPLSVLDLAGYADMADNLASQVSNLANEVRSGA